MKTKMIKALFVIVIVLLVNLGWAGSTLAQSGTPDAKIEINQWKVGFIVGVGGGGGTLTYKGKSYPLVIKGLRVGATIGAATADLVGDVYNLKTLKDIEGTYSAAQAAVAVGAGVKAWTLENQNKVTLNLKGKQVGIELALDVGGMKLELK
jgi:hypothetical protein